MENSGISWTDNTFNPWIGCTKVSEACRFCYAERDMDQRFGRVEWGPNGQRSVTSEENWKKPIRWNKQAIKPMCPYCGTHASLNRIGADDLEEFCSACQRPIDSVQYRPRVFCASLADVFEEWVGPMVNSKGEVLEVETPPPDGVPRPVTMDDERRRLFALIDATPNLDWLLLTKRPENIRKMWPTEEGYKEGRSRGPDIHVPRSNVWLGATVENQEQAEKRIPELLKCRDLSPVLWLSCEPLLGNLDLSFVPCLDVPEQYQNPAIFGLNWVIAGGESGPEARPTPDGAFESLVEQCKAAGVPFHFKQMSQAAHPNTFKDFDSFPESLKIREFPEVSR